MSLLVLFGGQISVRSGGGGGGVLEPLLFFFFSVLSHIQALLSVFFRHILQKRCRCHVQLSIISQMHKGLQRLSKLLKWAHDFYQR